MSDPDPKWTGGNVCLEEPAILLRRNGGVRLVELDQCAQLPPSSRSDKLARPRLSWSIGSLGLLSYS
jgi:hypothetical protein